MGVFYKPRKVNKYLVVGSRIATALVGANVWKYSGDIILTAMVIPLMLMVFDIVIKTADDYLFYGR